MPAALVFWAMIIGIIDLRQKKVPNLLLLVVILPAVAGLIWQGYGPFGANPWQSLIGAVLTLALLLPWYAVGLLGAGDVKYGGCIGFLVGHWLAVLLALACAGLALGLGSLLAILVCRVRGQSVKGIRIPAAPALSIGFGVICGLRFLAGT